MTTNDKRDSQLITPREAAQRLLEEAALQALRSRGLEGLVSVRVGGKRVYRAADVESYLLRLQAA